MHPRIAALFALLLLACESSTGLEFERQRRPGTIEHYHDPVVLEVPDTVSAGAPFEITIRTYVGGCDEAGGTDVVRTDGRIEVSPFDFDRTPLDPNVGCPDRLGLIDHRVTSSFDAPGVGIVVIQGREEPSLEAKTVERTVVVR